MDNHPKLSQQVSSQLPGFVRADHPLFVSFLEAYYDWLETTGSVGKYEGGLDLLSQRDIDTTFESFVQYFKKEYLLDFPETLATDVSGNPLNQKNLLKNIRDFYRAKGTEAAYKFLFRILYNSSVEFYYPKEDILRLSDGKWVQRTSIKTTSNNGTNLFTLLGQEVKQRDDYGTVIAYGRIVDIQLYAVDGVQMSELFLAGIFGTFLPNRNCEGTNTDGVLLTEFVMPVIESITLDSGGIDYQPGETLELKAIDTTKENIGSGFLARVEEVDTQSSLYKTDEEIQLGAIKKLRIVDFGVNYKNITDWKVIVDSPFGAGATFTISIGGMSRYPGYYEGTDGQLSSAKKIQDSNYYQQFSYVLQVESSYEKWITAIKKLIHPAGMQVFGEVLLYRKRINTIDASHNEMRVYEDPLIGHYTPYTFNTHENIRNNSKGIDLYPQGYNPYACEYSPEWGVTAHNPYGVPAGLSSSLVTGAVTGPLSANINDIDGHNSLCPSFDGNNLEFGSSACSNVTGWSSCEQTPFAVSSSAGGTTGSYGCCDETEYWIIYPHPNSRGISYIPPTVNVKRLWFYGSTDNLKVSLTNANSTDYPFDVHENIQLKRELDFSDASKITGSDLRSFTPQQKEVELGKIYAIEWYDGATGNDVTGADGVTQVQPLLRLDVYPLSSNFFASKYQGNAVTGYFLETEYSELVVGFDLTGSSGTSITSATSNTIFSHVAVEDKTIPNPFLHIMLNDFLHMPIHSGLTGTPYQHRSTTKQDLKYTSVG